MLCYDAQTGGPCRLPGRAAAAEGTARGGLSSAATAPRGVAGGPAAVLAGARCHSRRPWSRVGSVRRRERPSRVCAPTAAGLPAESTSTPRGSLRQTTDNKRPHKRPRATASPPLPPAEYS